MNNTLLQISYGCLIGGAVGFLVLAFTESYISCVFPSFFHEYWPFKRTEYRDFKIDQIQISTVLGRDYSKTLAYIIKPVTGIDAILVRNKIPPILQDDSFANKWIGPVLIHFVELDDKVRLCIENPTFISMYFAPFLLLFMLLPVSYMMYLEDPIIGSLMIMITLAGFVILIVLSNYMQRIANLNRNKFYNTILGWLEIDVTQQIAQK